jgi:hypothetical protein
MLFGNGLNLYNAEGYVDLFRETYYTSAIWNIISDRVCQHRRNEGIHKVKMMVPIGAGTTPAIEEEQLLLEDYVLIRHIPENIGGSLKCTSAEIFEILDVSPTRIEWRGEKDLQEFLDMCIEMVRIWTPASVWKEWKGWSYDDAYGDPKERCQFAVNLSIPSRSVQDRIQLMVNCINHHSSTSIFDLKVRTAQFLSYPELRTPTGRRLFTCWLDFAIKQDRMLEAQPPATVIDVEALPENVLDISAAAASGAKATKTAGGKSATPTATSAAETRSTATSAAESVPHPTSQPPRQPEPHQPLNIPPTVPEWLTDVYATGSAQTTTGPRQASTPSTSAAAAASASASAPAGTAGAVGSPTCARGGRRTASGKTPPSPAKSSTSATGRTPPIAGEGPQTRSRSGQLSPPKKSASQKELETDE